MNRPDEQARAEAGAASSQTPRRRRRGKKRSRARPAAEEAARPAAAEESQLDATKPAEEPLSPPEAAEMRGHLRFLRRHRRLLRLKVNAAEDRLLSGTQEPTHRGQCLHLLSKVDLSCVQSALSRTEDPKQRLELLAGIVRFSSDVGVLLHHLEELERAASRREAAAAFGAAVRRIDFQGLSAARVRRVLDLIAATFEGHDRVQVLFGLLQGPGFRQAFEAAAPGLPDELADVFVPLLAVREVIFEGHRDRFGADALRRGVTVILSSPPDVLRSYAQAVRERLLESAVRLVEDRELEDRAAATLLASLPHDSRAFSSLGMLRAGELLERHEDEAARELLEAVRSAHAGFRMPERWLAALASPRAGRVALEDPEAPGARRRASRAAATRLRRGFWLDRQRPVWVRTVPPAERPRLEREILLQREVAGPGVAVALTWGTGEVPHVAMPAIGRVMDPAPRGRKEPVRGRLEACLEGLRVLLALARRGVALPDAAPGRFVVEPTASPPLLLLADLDGADWVPPALAEHRHASLAPGWCDAVLGPSPPPWLPSLLAGSPALGDLVEALAWRA